MGLFVQPGNCSQTTGAGRVTQRGGQSSRAVHGEERGMFEPAKAMNLGECHTATKAASTTIPLAGASRKCRRRQRATLLTTVGTFNSSGAIVARYAQGRNPEY